MTALQILTFHSDDYLKDRKNAANSSNDIKLGKKCKELFSEYGESSCNHLIFRQSEESAIVTQVPGEFLIIYKVSPENLKHFQTQQMNSEHLAILRVISS